MTWILIVVFSSYGWNKGFSVSEFKSKKACEMAIHEVRGFMNVIEEYTRCVEVKE